MKTYILKMIVHVLGVVHQDLWKLKEPWSIRLSQYVFRLMASIDKRYALNTWSDNL